MDDFSLNFMIFGIGKQFLGSSSLGFATELLDFGCSFFTSFSPRKVFSTSLGAVKIHITEKHNNLSQATTLICCCMTEEDSAVIMK